MKVEVSPLQSLGQVSVAHAAKVFRDFLRGSVRTVIREVRAAEVTELCGFSHLPSPSRHRDGPDDVFGGYKGNLLGDCWSGFQKIDIRSDSRITFAACWSHAHRKFDECRWEFPIQAAKPESLIRMLYDVEDQIKSLDESERLARRGSLSRHVLGLIEQYLDGEAMSPQRVLPKSNLGQAAAYVRRHWQALTRFVDIIRSRSTTTSASN